MPLGVIAQSRSERSCALEKTILRRSSAGLLGVMQAAGGHREEEVAGPGLQHQEALAVCSFVLSQSEHSLEGLMGS